MKTKITSANGHDAYELGYLVGSKQMTIRDFEVIDWENDYKQYRRGYNTGYQHWYKQFRQIKRPKRATKKVDL